MLCRPSRSHRCWSYVYGQPSGIISMPSVSKSRYSRHARHRWRPRRKPSPAFSSGTCHCTERPGNYVPVRSLVWRLCAAAERKLLLARCTHAQRFNSLDSSAKSFAVMLRMPPLPHTTLAQLFVRCPPFGCDPNGQPPSGHPATGPQDPQ
eukprot:8445016-Pyramimonas_sp.AAC.1